MITNKFFFREPNENTFDPKKLKNNSEKNVFENLYPEYNCINEQYKPSETEMKLILEEYIKNANINEKTVEIND
jgi:hypothetical protein